MSQNAPAPASTTRRRWLRGIAIAAAAVVPLAFAGLTMASLGDAEAGIDRIPAAIVNNDEMVTQTAADGTETPVLAGRLLVTELTGDASPGMDWQLSSTEEAERKLADGEVYAVLTIPSDFSASVVSLSTAEPVQAQLDLATDDAHSYLAGAAAQSLGDAMVKTFGSQLTEQYISGIYSQFGTVGDAFTQAADGATQLSDGAQQAADGAAQYADGVAQYTSGVSTLSSGLRTMSQQTAGLGQLGTGVSGYTAGVTQVSGGLSQLTQAMAADPRFSGALADPTLAPYLTQLQQLNGGLSTIAAGGPALASGASGLGQLASGIAQTSSGASQLAANGSTISSGAQSLADGNAQLAAGASELATGLQGGASQMSGTSVPSDDAAAVAAEPVGLEVTTENPVTQLGQVIGTYLVPLGLWVGALAIFLVIPPLSRRVLATTAGSGRVLGSAFLRATGIAGIQAVLLVLLMHLVAGVDWALLPATLGYALVAAAAFTAFHQLLTIGLGRAGLIISLLLMSVQLATLGSIIPSQALAGPFGAIAGLMPLGWATTGLQQIVAGGSAGAAIGSALGLAAFGAASLLVSRLAIRRTRRANALGLLHPATA